MRVVQVEGEPTRYHVESTSLECPSCQKLFPRLMTKNKDLVIGDVCPACEIGTLDVRFHLVDLSMFWPIGRCSCEHWSFNLKKKIEKLSPSQVKELTQGEARQLRCTHIEAARTAALDTTIRHHEASRMVHARGRTEESAP